MSYDPKEVGAGIFDGKMKKVSELSLEECQEVLCQTFELLEKVDSAKLSTISKVCEEIRDWLTGSN